MTEWSTKVETLKAIFIGRPHEREREANQVTLTDKESWKRPHYELQIVQLTLPTLVLNHITVGVTSEATDQDMFAPVCSPMHFRLLWQGLV